MTQTPRAALLAALKRAYPLDLDWDTIASCLHATPDLVANPARLAEVETVIEATAFKGEPLPYQQRAAALPVLGNLAEAVVESLLVDFGWQPVYDDTAGISYGHGVDLVMMDPVLERLVTIEVKSTIQRQRWPRLARGLGEQLTPEWLERSDNVGMREWGLGAADVYLMVAQVHWSRRAWRACLAADPDRPQPVTGAGQLIDLTWLDADRP